MQAFKITRHGFTLIELLIVIAIISVLLAIGLGVAGTARSTARDAKRSTDLKLIQASLDAYFQNKDADGSYPYPVDIYSNESAWKAVMPQVPKDPQGKNYLYTAPACLTLDSTQKINTISQVTSTYKTQLIGSSAEAGLACPQTAAGSEGSGWVPYLLEANLERPATNTVNSNRFLSLTSANNKQLLYSIQRPIHP